MQLPRVTIIGAGMAGLTAHLALRQAGFDVVHFERRPEFRVAGGNFLIWPNGGKVFQTLGLGEQLKKIGIRLNHHRALDSHGVPISSVDFDELAKAMQFPAVFATRHELHAMLLDAVGPKNIVMGRELLRVERDGSNTKAVFADGTSVTCDVLLGADGVRSAVRNAVSPSTEPRYVGLSYWTGYFPDNGFLAKHSPHPSSLLEYWGPEGRCMVQSSGTNQVGFAFISRMPDGTEPDNPLEWLTRRFGHYPPLVAALIERLADVKVIFWPIFDVEPLESWAAGRVAVLGDAAHASAPSLGQGANMCMEDGFVIAQALADTSVPIDERLRRFEARRRARTEMIVRESRARGIAATEPDPVKIREMQDSARAATKHPVFNNTMQDIVRGGPLE